MQNFIFTVMVQYETKADAIKFAHELANSSAFKGQEPMMGIQVSLPTGKLFRVSKDGEVGCLETEKSNKQLKNRPGSPAA